MTPKLLVLVFAVGTVAGYPLYGVRDDTPVVSLVDAGVLEGDPYPLACRVRVSPAIRAAIIAAGEGARLQGRYGVLPYRARKLGSNVIMQEDPRGVELFGPDPCRPLTETWDGGFASLPFPCACRGSAGQCTVTLPDGGTEPAVFGNTLSEGTFTGAGCRRKACVELAGDSSWPSVCPSLPDGGG